MERTISVKGVATQERILKKALDLYNRQGIEYVGVRELAAELEMRPSHITYYFPTKEDIILALAKELRALNQKTLDPADQVRTLDDLLESFHQVMRNHLRYRCLPLSMPLMMDQLPRLRKHLRGTHAKRQQELSVMLDGMIASSALRALTKEEKEYLIHCCGLLSRGWLADSIISGSDPSKRIPHYLKLLEWQFHPFLGA